MRCLFARAPPLTFMRGAFDLGPAKEKPTRERRPRATQEKLVVTKATQLTGAEIGGGGVGLQQTELLVQSTMRQLVAAFKSNERRPICYFRFVLDPDSFGATVENVFHISFLVKEERVRIIFVDLFSQFLMVGMMHAV